MSSNKGTLLVTGVAGFIGANFVRLAVSKGYDVVGLDLLTYAGKKENLENLPGPGKFTLKIGNICDNALVKELLAVHEPKALINFAAESHVDRSIESPTIFIETNVLGTGNLLNNALKYWNTLSSTEKADFRYVQISTDEVYGQLGPTGKFSEKTPVDPSSPYSASKTGGDHLVQAWNHTFGLPTIITRCSNNYGPLQFPEKLIPHMIQCALTGKKLPVYGKGENVRDWIHVEDHCQGILLALEKGKPGSTYCLGGNSERKNIDVVRTICATLDELHPRKDGKSYAEQISFVTDRLGHDFRYAIDDSFAKKELGFQQKYNFEDGLRDTIKWYLENYSWRDA
jgi:dTDP-glucose 4,6-dehydratase